MTYKFCPRCASELVLKNELMTCPTGDFVHYDNPLPVVSGLVPRLTAVSTRSGSGSTTSSWWEGKIYNYFNTSEVLLVKRAVEPFIGQWCLPCGHIDKGETPKQAAVREIFEETRHKVRIEKLLSACAPSMTEYSERLNYVVIFYLARFIAVDEGKLAHDVVEAKWFNKNNLPDICFRSHKMIVTEWFKGTWGRLTGTDL